MAPVCWFLRFIETLIKQMKAQILFFQDLETGVYFSKCWYG